MHQNLGLLAKAEGELKEAGAAFDVALSLLLPPGASPGTRVALAHCHRGDIAQALGQPELAKAHYWAAIMAADHGQSIGERGIYSRRWLSHPSYRWLSSLLEEGELEGAFTYGEGLRAPLEPEDLDLPAKSDDDNAGYWLARAAIDALVTELPHPPSIPPRVDWPRPPTIITKEGLKRFCQSLDEGTLYVSFYTHIDGLIALGLLKGDEECQLLAHSSPLGVEALEDRIRLFRRAINNEVDERWRPQARALYDALLAPFQGALERSSSLLLALDGPLETLPFAALISPKGRPLIWEHPLSMTTSLARLRSDAQRPKTGPLKAKWLGFGAPTSANEADSLPGASQELEEIASAVGAGAELILGDSATAEAFFALPSPLGVIHIAAHGILKGGAGARSGLRLSPGEGERGKEAGGSDLTALMAGEIEAGLRLDCDLAVLSVCHSGQGEALLGEGVLGLSRSMKVAGARSTVSTLWAVEDSTMRALMGRFYQQLIKGEPRHIALQKALMGLSQAPGYGHPRHWAGLRLEGARGSISSLSHGKPGTTASPVGGGELAWSMMLLMGLVAVRLGRYIP